MTLAQLEDTLEQIDALRKALALSQRAVPFVEEVLKEISPLIDEIHRSIEESTHKIPRATTQLQSVTQATELAATEIMDLVDAMVLRIGEVRSCIEQQARCEVKLHENKDQLIELLRERLKGKDDALLAEVEGLAGEAQLIHQVRSTLHPAVANGLEDVRQMSNKIMVSLQVQDITSQQLASVNHLIESIRTRMSTLVHRLNTGLAESFAEKPEARLTFDPDARYDRSGNRQDAADALIDTFFSGVGASGSTDTTSQDDIDALFGATDGPASQNDIDALFGAPQVGGDGGSVSPVVPPAGPVQERAPEVATQDDIDAIFRNGF